MYVVILSLCTTDVRQALVGVGMISWDDRAMYASLEKGML